MPALNTERPAWNFNELTEQEFRNLNKCYVTVWACGKYDSGGNGDGWLEGRTRSGHVVRFHHNWAKVLRFVGFDCFPGLFELTALGCRMQDAIVEIAAWEKENAAERAEYERLKKKFEGSK